MRDAWSPTGLIGLFGAYSLSDLAQLVKLEFSRRTPGHSNLSIQRISDDWLPAKKEGSPHRTSSVVPGLANDSLDRSRTPKTVLHILPSPPLTHPLPDHRLGKSSILHVDEPLPTPARFLPQQFLV